MTLAHRRYTYCFCPGGYVAFIHGRGGDQAEYLVHAEEPAGLGCIYFTFDLRGHADNDADKERVTRQDGPDDVLAASPPI